MLKLEYTVKMKKDVKRMSGNLAGFRECHIESDWLLLYRIFEDKLILSASGTGTHADLFDE